MVGSPARRLVSWVMAKTKTRSMVETRTSAEPVPPACAWSAPTLSSLLGRRLHAAMGRGAAPGSSADDAARLPPAGSGQHGQEQQAGRGRDHAEEPEPAGGQQQPGAAATRCRGGAHAQLAEPLGAGPQ